MYLWTLVTGQTVSRGKREKYCYFLNLHAGGMMKRRRGKTRRRAVYKRAAPFPGAALLLF